MSLEDRRHETEGQDPLWDLAGLAANPCFLNLVCDTWEWDGENWTQVDDIGPSARKWLAFAYDSSRNRAVLFGGLSEDGPSGETWELGRSGLDSGFRIGTFPAHTSRNGVRQQPDG